MAPESPPEAQCSAPVFTGPCWLRCGQIATERDGSGGSHVMSCPSCGDYVISQRGLLAAAQSLDAAGWAALAKRVHLEHASGGVLAIGAGNVAALALEGRYLN
jgi:hypothetical protein